MANTVDPVLHCLYQQEKRIEKQSTKENNHKKRRIYMDWLSVLPPLIAIVIVIWKKEVVLALLIAVLSAECLIILQSDPRSLLLTPIYTVDRVVSTVTSEGNAR
ncbi:MAG: hypothetical protein AAGJ37_18050, partial [Pseudomonadota bacterium]